MWSAGLGQATVGARLWLRGEASVAGQCGRQRAIDVQHHAAAVDLGVAGAVLDGRGLRDIAGNSRCWFHHWLRKVFPLSGVELAASLRTGTAICSNTLPSITTSLDSSRLMPAWGSSFFLNDPLCFTMSGIGGRALRQELQQVRGQRPLSWPHAVQRTAGRRAPGCALERAYAYDVAVLQRAVLCLDALAVDLHAAEAACVVDQHARGAGEKACMLLVVQADFALGAFADGAHVGHAQRLAPAVGVDDFKVDHWGLPVAEVRGESHWVSAQPSRSSMRTAENWACGAWGSTCTRLPTGRFWRTGALMSGATRLRGQRRLP